MAPRHPFEQPSPRIVSGRFVAGPGIAEADKELVGGAQFRRGGRRGSVFLGLGCRRGGSLDRFQLFVLGHLLDLELLRLLPLTRLIVVGVWRGS